jgi:hypothetical protein
MSGVCRDAYVGVGVPKGTPTTALFPQEGNVLGRLTMGLSWRPARREPLFFGDAS